MSELVIESCDPREREVDIKGLFARNGEPQFEAVFERAYRPRAEHGLRSWIGHSGEKAVMHISVTPLRFTNGERTLMGGVLGDLMVDESHRDFWTPVKLLRALVTDLTQDRQIDFLVTSTVADAEAVFKATGFSRLGDYRRFVLPLMRPYLTAIRIRGSVRAATAAERTMDEEGLRGLVSSFKSAGSLRPEVSAEFYDTRIPRCGYADGRWVRVEGKKKAETLGWVLVSRHSKLPELMLADAFWQEGCLLEVIHAVASWARAQGFPKLVIGTLSESRVARQLTKAGCLRRPKGGVLLVRQLSEVPSPPADDLFLTGFAMNSW